jgi:hypothetical protein
MKLGRAAPAVSIETYDVSIVTRSPSLSICINHKRRTQQVQVMWNQHQYHQRSNHKSRLCSTLEVPRSHHQAMDSITRSYHCALKPRRKRDKRRTTTIAEPRLYLQPHAATCSNYSANSTRYCTPQRLWDSACIR